MRRERKPVSGTVTTIWVQTEQTEPIGQTLHIIDPEDPPQPIPPDTMIQNADYPQWRCEERNASQLYGGFHEWPEECRKRYMQDMDVTVYDFSKNDAEQNPTNLTKLINNFKHTLPSSDAGLVFATRSMMSRALTSSTRDDDDGEGCDWDKDGTPECAVSVTYAYHPIDMSDTGGPDASVSYVGDISTNKNDKIKNAINMADTILGGDNECSKFFISHASYGKESIDAALLGLDKALVKGAIDNGSNPNKTIGIKMSAPIIGPGYRIFETAVANQYGAFFDPTNKVRFGSGFPGFNGYLPDTNQVRVLLLLHELAHMILDKKGKSLIPDDKANDYKGSSKKNTDKILEHCKKEIDKIKN